MEVFIRMWTFIGLVISFVLGFNVGKQYESNKYVILDDGEEDQIVGKKPRVGILKRIGHSIRRNLF